MSVQGRPGTPQRKRWEKRKRHEAKERLARWTDKQREKFKQSGCEGKIRHATGAEANKQAARVLEKRGWHVVAYKCAFCPGWHLGRRRGRAGDRPDDIRLTEEE